MHRTRIFIAIGTALALGACAVPHHAVQHAADRQDGDSVDPDTAAAASMPADEAILAIRPQAYAEAAQRRMAALVSDAADVLESTDAGYYMDLQEANLRQALRGTGLQIEREANRIALILPGSDSFDTGRTALEAEAAAWLDAVAAVLVQYPLTFLAVHGHTDPVGDSDYNLHLSEQRALDIARRLVAGGIRPDRIIAVGHGESVPAVTATSPANRSPDRRIEVHLAPVVR